MRYASRMQQLAATSSSAWDVHHIAAEMLARGEDAILLTVGDTDFASPSIAVETACLSLSGGRTHYAASAGDRPVRAAIARRHFLQTGQTVDPDQVIVTLGAQNALFTAALCLVEPGDEVIVPEPMYVTYPGTIVSAGAQVVAVPSPAENGFHPDLAALEAAVTRRTRAIFLATPNNPTGAIYTADELAAIGEICMRHDLWLVSDEVYRDLVFEGVHTSPASLPGIGSQTVTIGSLSKSHAMAGWRLGWMIAPLGLAAHAARMTTCTTYGIPTFLQDAAATVLDELPNGLPGMLTTYRRRRDRLSDVLDAAPGLQCHRPAGGMFCMLDVRSTGVSSYEFADGLVRSEGVALLPADEFGPTAVGYLRINLGVSDDRVDEAASRIARYAERLKTLGWAAA
jgi:arginine:pyruvate transaminase